MVIGFLILQRRNNWPSAHIHINAEGIDLLDIASGTFEFILRLENVAFSRLIRTHCNTDPPCRS